MLRLVMVIGLVVVALGATSCVSASHDELMRFFFDGVPPKDGKPLTAKGRIVKAGSRKTDAAGNLELLQTNQTMSVHSPFARHNCTACHKSESLSKLAMDKSKLCMQCHEGVLLMNKGARLSSLKYTELQSAIRSNDQKTVEALVRGYGKTATAADSDDNITPLHVAAALDRPEIAGVLIGAGAKIDARTSGGFTPLHWAASRGSVKTAALLLDAGANLDARAPSGLTALLWARRNAKKDMECLLLLRSSSEGVPKKTVLPSLVPHAKFVHAPADGGECDSCHSPHKSEQLHLLLSAVPDLCFGCHDKGDITKSKGHAGMGARRCLECHEAHSGNIKGLLREGLAATGAK